MKKTIFILFVLFSLFLNVIAEDTLVFSFQKNFIKSSILQKKDLLQDASKMANTNMDALYIDALHFSIQNYPILGSDPQLIDIAVLSIEKLKITHDPSFLQIVKQAFENIPEPRVQIACFSFISEIKEKELNVDEYLTNWLKKELQRYQDGELLNNKVLVEGIQAVYKVGASSSFDVLFSFLLITTDQTIKTAAINALISFSDVFFDKILANLDKKDIQVIYMAHTLIQKNTSLSNEEQGILIAKVFSQTLEIDTDGSSAIKKQLLDASLDKITLLKWTDASAALVKYFYKIQLEYKNNPNNLNALIKVINALSVMGTSEASQALSIFLGVLNSEVEQTKKYNEQLVLAVINALGELGDKNAFDYLVYIGYLDYPEFVKQASRDAIARLMW